MRKDNWFVILLVALCLALAAMAAVSSSPSGDEKPEFAGFDSLDEATVTENWKRYFPAQYEGWTRTAEMQQTMYGGGGRAEAEGMDIHKIDYLKKYPFLKVAYDGFGFSKGFYRSRGHFHALNDVIDTERLPDWDKRPATCIGCKTTDVTKLDALYGDDWYSMPFSKVIGTNTIGCLDCHSPEDASIRHARTWLDEGMAHGTFANIDPEGRTDLVCAQCHTNYHFNAETRKVELPWTTGLHVEAQLEHYDAARRSDEWVHPRTGALVAKMQHPEFELYTEGKEVNIHSRMGLQCTDCHMPKAVDTEGEEYTYHHWTSPLTHVENTCLGCHSNWGAAGVIERTEGIQGEVYTKQNRIGEDLATFIDAVAAKRENGSVDEVTMTRLQQIHREAQFYWDFIWVENSEGFHNWAEAHRVLDKADALIKEGMEVLDSV
ncbi:MAG: ammonia-forming cytochrome c nitrite reductase subunit c552 [Wenzhouxiangella sp.]|jgi:nitrite reductase (cytochrome c-552)|nr:ammonia-forming cytochrome c nitrite reductase subunit c552 [Wenzhouxiangella sp.]